MRSSVAVSVFALLALIAAPAVASAGVKINEKTKSYQIAGTTGLVLLEAMDRKGPKHGFLTRAIAQTSYTVSWKIEWAQTEAACRVRRVDGQLDLTYTYPQPKSGLSRDLSRRWERFMSGVRKHERHHGTLAREMTRVAERSITGVVVPGDRSCVRAKREVKRRMATIYAAYEAKQVAFDRVEHGNRGTVEGLIYGLVRAR